MGDQHEKKVIGFSELKERYLLHRYPILLLDRVTDYSPKEFIEAIKCVTGNSPELVGHFPERAIMPGTSIIQSFAQLAIVFYKLSNGPLNEDEMTVITSANFKFMGPVVPGDILYLSMKPKELSDSVYILQGNAKVDSRRVSAGTLTLAKTSIKRYADIPW